MLFRSERDTSSWTDLEQAQHDPAPLVCLFLLDRQTEGDQTVESVRLSPGAAFARLIGNAYSFRPSDSERKQRMVESYLALVSLVPAYTLRFASTLGELPVLLDRIESVVDNVLAR